MWALLQQSLGVVFEPITLLYICVGTVVGTVMGAMPGISASMAVVIAMTFSYALEPLPRHHRRRHQRHPVLDPRHAFQRHHHL